MFVYAKNYFKTNKASHKNNPPMQSPHPSCLFQRLYSQYFGEVAETKTYNSFLK